MFWPLIYGHLQVLIQSSLRKRVLYLLGLGGGGARSHFTNYGYCGLVFGVLGVLPRCGWLWCQYAVFFVFL
jgi:hypothetical protein